MTLPVEGELVRGLVVVLEELRSMELNNLQSRRGYLYVRKLIRVERDHLDRLDHRVPVESP